MTTTPATEATEAKIVAVRVGHSGRKIHRAVDGINQSGVHYRYTACGADRRGIGITATYVVDAPINCLACSPAPAAEEAAPVAVAVPAAATRDEVTEAIPAARFAAVRQNGRYRVVTTGVGAAAPGRVVATCASRAKAEEKAAKLNADLSADLAAAPAVVADQVAALADSVRDGDVSFTDAVGTLLGTPVAPAVRKGPAPEVVAEAVKQFQAELDAVAPALGKVMSEPLPGEKLVNVYVGASVAELIIPRRDDADATIAAIARKLADRQPNAQNYRHVKLSVAERGALAGVATAIENDATTAGQGLLARAARTLRARIAATA